MRTSVELDADTAAVVEALCRAEGLEASEAVNVLIRRGMTSRQERGPFVQRTHELGLSIDVANVADALDALDGPLAR